MRNWIRITHGLLAGASLSIFGLSPALARDAAPAPSSEGVADIVVTAERRDVSLQQAPISVSAITADTLKASGITNVTGLNGEVPGLVVARSGGGELILSIRGVGSETPENTNTQPGVSFHVDGAYIFNSIAASAAFIDVAQVEVLRGPQGTLFGQGSTGGTINVVSAQPSTDAMSAKISAGIGNYNYQEGNAALNLPITQTLALRGAFQFTKHDGYAHATQVAGVARYDLDDQDETGWHLAAKWAPTSNFSVVLSTIQYTSNTNGAAQKNILDPESDPRLLTQDYPGMAKVRTQLYTGTVKWDLPGVTVKSITSYQKLHSEQAWDTDGLDEELFYAATYSDLLGYGYTYDHTAMWQSDAQSYTQEINLASNGSGPFNWVAGAVYLHTKNTQYVVEYKGSDDESLRGVIARDTAWDDPSVSYLNYAELSSITRKDYALYAQATYEILPALSLTAGARYNHDKAMGTYDALSGGAVSYSSGTYLQPYGTGSRKAGAWTGKVALDYRVTPENLLYASWTRGFKPGGINSASAGGNGGLGLGLTNSIKDTYQEETVDSFEIGSKNRFLDDTLQLNASAFYYKYTNMQFMEEDPVLYAEGISNAPKADVWGIELETRYKPTRHLTFDATGSWLEGKFTAHYLALDPSDAAAAQEAAGYPGDLFWSNYYAASLARDAARKDIYGNRVPKLPRWQGNIAATWNGKVGPGEFTGRVQAIYRGKYIYRVFNESSVDQVPSYAQVNLLLKYEPENTGAFVSLRVTNLFNEDGVNSRFSDPYGSAQVFETYVPPRQAVLSVGWSY